jgi:hypothetical protein
MTRRHGEPPAVVESRAGGSVPAAYRAGISAIAGFVFLVEAAVFAGLIAGHIGPSMALLCHGAVVGMLLIAMLLAVRHGKDIGPHLLLLPAVTFTGPFGALGGVFIGRLSRRGRSDVERLEDWYERLALSTELDPTARLADHVLTGRAIDFSRGLPASIPDLIETGTIAQKQAILGVIARRFHPDYLPGLQAALVAEEPVIRVQAAAVAAKIRGDLPAYIERLLREASDVSQPPDRIVMTLAEARGCVASGLLEAKDRERIERLIDGLLARTMLRVERGGLQQIKTGGTALDAFENQLLLTRRHMEFRRLRKMRTWAARGPWVWRPVQAQVRAQTQAQTKAQATRAATNPRVLT